MPHKDPEVRKAYKKRYGKKYAKQNPEKLKEKAKAFYQRNKEKIRKKQQEYRKNNREKVLAYQKQYGQNHRDKKKKRYLSKLEQVQELMKSFYAYKRRRAWDQLQMDLESLEELKRKKNTLRKIKWRIVRQHIEELRKEGKG